MASRSVWSEISATSSSIPLMSPILALRSLRSAASARLLCAVPLTPAARSFSMARASASWTLVSSMSVWTLAAHRAAACAHLFISPECSFSCSTWSVEDATWPWMEEAAAPNSCACAALDMETSRAPPMVCLSTSCSLLMLSAILPISSLDPAAAWRVKSSLPAMKLMWSPTPIIRPATILAKKKVIAKPMAKMAAAAEICDTRRLLIFRLTSSMPMSVPTITLLPAFVTRGMKYDLNLPKESVYSSTTGAQLFHAAKKPSLASPYSSMGYLKSPLSMSLCGAPSSTYLAFESATVIE